MFKKQTIWSGRAPLSNFNFWTSRQVPVAIYGLDPDTKERVRLYRIFVSLIVAQNPYISTFIQVPYTDCADVPLEVTLSNSKDFSYVSKSGGRISRESMQTKIRKSFLFTSFLISLLKLEATATTGEAVLLCNFGETVPEHQQKWAKQHCLENNFCHLDFCFCKISSFQKVTVSFTTENGKEVSQFRYVSAFQWVLFSFNLTQSHPIQSHL